LEGFHDLIPPELISIFDAHELELLISGLPEIDVDDLRGNTDYHGYQVNDPVINYFWNVVKSLSKEDKAQLIQFITGSSKVSEFVFPSLTPHSLCSLLLFFSSSLSQVPLEGFKALQGADGIKRFNIHKSYGGDRILPSAHTCFNQLDLPEYSSEEILREKLLIAIKEGSEGFGFA
jgi:E3 ubiquitin-protein ligase HUWE1